MASQSQAQQGFIPKKTLTLNVWYRLGSDFVDERVCWVEYGKAKVDEVYDKDVCKINFPYRCPGKMTVEPESDYVVVKCLTRDNTSGRMMRELDTYVYMKDRGGWLWL